MIAQSFARRVVLLAGTLFLAFGFSSTVISQTSSSFTMDRYNNAGESAFETFYVENSESMQAALNAGKLSGETMLLITENAAGNLALVRDQMAFHHIVQGTAAGKNWMATF